ncbi:deoxyguanosinetriphosphate triphosphohydrolase [bacterium Unc6]|nr:deoxyguanosinetriphosphate triphosphohydrolase [bacterium Unc6]
MDKNILEQREEKMLSMCACKSKTSRGRKYSEKDDIFRTHFQRDRDRIIHSMAFRRLQYKTQVFVFHEDDYYRTRLTHTMEVAQIARSIARALGLNDDLTEAIALAHDIGHTPFGHCGEDALHEIMKDSEGFEHNLQGYRVVTSIEQRYAEFPGLNLTWEAREGILKHSTPFNKLKILQIAPEIQDFGLESPPTLEAQVVDIADEIAYDSHDLDDGLASGLVHENQLSEVELWNRQNKKIKEIYTAISWPIRRNLVVKSIINIEITDIIHGTSEKIKDLKIEDVCSMDKRIVGFSQELEEHRIPLKKFLLENLYRHFKVVRMSEKHKRFIKELFDVYKSNKQQLPLSVQKRAEKIGLKRSIADYIAGMTDRFALDEYDKLFDPHQKV